MLHDMLKFDEGCRNLPYDDATSLSLSAPVGKMTIGIGRNLNAKPLSNNAIYYLFLEDLSDAICDARMVLGYDAFERLSFPRKAALINLAFNMGATRLATFKRMLKAIREENWERAAVELLDSKWASQVDPKKRKEQGRDYRVYKLLFDEENIYTSL